jgi:23S rRNA (guanosine2251-2'-O)-methyltransferase
MNAARSRGVAVSLVEPRALDDATRRGNHQGVAVEVGPYPYVDLDDMLGAANGRTLLLLDRLQDPQNLATLIRTAAAADAAGVMIQTDRSAAVTPAVVHASAGIVERLRVARVTNSGRAVATCKDAGYWAVALEHNEESQDIFDTEIPSPALLIVGSEGSGVSVPALKAADIVVHLPMPGGVESLNAAVAGSIALYELLSRAPEDDDMAQGPETLH